MDAGIRWSWATLAQIERVRAHEHVVAAGVFDRPADYGHEQRIPFLRLRTDTHFCIVAARNLVRAIEALGPLPDGDSALPAELCQHIRILRNCFEHWDERYERRTPRSGAAYREFDKRFPADDPGSYTFDGSHTTVGGLSLNDLEGHAQRLLDFFLELEKGWFVWKGWEYR